MAYNSIHTGSEIDEAVTKTLADEGYTTFTTSSSIESLPVGSLKGSVDNFEAEGLTLVNSVENGDFSDGTTGWTPAGATLGVSNNVLTLTGNGINRVPRVDQIFAPSFDDKYFIYSKYRVTDSDCDSIRFVFDSGIVGEDLITVNITNPLVNVWYELYGTEIIPSSWGTGTITLYFEYPDTATANGKVMEVDGNAGVHAINMTALGIESLTEAQMLDLVRSGYIDGIQSVLRPTFKSVGKNLFDVNNIVLTEDSGSVSYEIKNEGIEVISTISGSERVKTNLFKLKPNTEYVFSADLQVVSGDGNPLVRMYDYINGGSTSNTTITSTATRYEIKFTTNEYQEYYFKLYNLSSIGTLRYYNIQLEEGTSATAYELYESSQLTADVPLRRVPNGVADKIYEQDGQIWLEKNVEGIDLLSGQVINTTNIPLASTTSSYLAYQTDGTTLVGVVDGTDTLTADATIHYELETPELINLTEQGLTEGELFSFENGTFYNSSDTFHAQNVAFDVPSNRAGQIGSLLESANTQSKQLANKANKVQEDVITPTITGGWTATNVFYYKDDFGIVHLSGFLTGGTGSAFTLASEYLPTTAKVFLQADSTTGTPKLTVGTDGTVTPSAACYLDGISFREGE